MKKIIAKFPGKCNETGLYISKGELMYYDYTAKKCYCMKSKIAEKFELDNMIPDNTIDGAEQAAYFDNFCANNNI